jgi:hypothetical protein
VMAAAAAARAKSSPPPRVVTGPAPAVDPDRPVDTVRAPPVATALTPATPAVYGGAVMPAAVGDRPRARRGNRGTVVALVALSLLLGAGVVAIIVMQNSSNAGPTQPLDLSQTSQTGSPEAGGSPPGTAPTTPPNNTIPSLNTGTSTHPTPSGHPGPAPTHSAGEPDAGGLGPPPFPIPSNLPPFPSNIPPFPSVLPPWPSGLLPPWPNSPPPPAPTHSGKEI